MKEKILITGASGFLGRHLVLALKNVVVFALDSKNCDLTKENSLEPYHSIKFDKIFHLAAWTQAGNFCLKHPGEQWLINQKINTHVLDFWKNKQPQALLICMGTSCAYDPQLPLVEENYFQGVPIDSLFTYAMTKRMLLAGLKALSTQFGLKYLYLIPSTLYGPSYHTDGRQLHFIFDLIRKILRGKHHREKVVLWGDGSQKRELIHVEDFIGACSELVAKGVHNTWLNVGGGKEYTIHAFAKMICDVTGFPLEEIEYDKTQYVGAKSKVLTITKLQASLPSFSPRPIEKGLRETIEWFEKTQM